MSPPKNLIKLMEQNRAKQSDVNVSGTSRQQTTESVGPKATSTANEKEIEQRLAKLREGREPKKGLIRVLFFFLIFLISI